MPSSLEDLKPVLEPALALLCLLKRSSLPRDQRFERPCCLESLICRHHSRGNLTRCPQFPLRSAGSVVCATSACLLVHELDYDALDAGLSAL